MRVDRWSPGNGWGGLGCAEKGRGRIRESGEGEGEGKGEGSGESVAECLFIRPRVSDRERISSKMGSCD